MTVSRALAVGVSMLVLTLSGCATAAWDSEELREDLAMACVRASEGSDSEIVDCFHKYGLEAEGL